MTRIGMNGIPGVNAALSTSDSEIYWGGDESRITVLRMDGTVVSTAVDAGNTPTTVLRKGLLLGKVTATGKLKEWDPDASDGSEDIYGVLDIELQMLDTSGSAVDQWCRVAVVGPIKASALRIQGSALVGHADEYLARRKLVAAGFRFDDDPQGFKAGSGGRIAIKSTNYTVVAADNGTQFQAITADATFTLPALKAGLEFEFLRVSDHNLVVASAEGDNIIVGNDDSADSISWSTASNKIGARVRVRGAYVNGTLKWLAEVLAAPFGTGAFLTQTLAT